MKRIVVIGDTIVDKNYFGEFSRCSPDDSGRSFRNAWTDHAVFLGGAANIQRMFAFESPDTARFVMPVLAENSTLGSFNFLPVLGSKKFDWKHRFWNCDRVAFRWDVRGEGIQVKEPMLSMSSELIEFIRSADVIVVSDYNKGFCKSLCDKFWGLIKPTAVILYEGKYLTDFVYGSNCIQKVSSGDFSGPPKKRLLEADNTSGLIVTNSGGPISVFSKTKALANCGGVVADFYNHAKPISGFHHNGAGDRFLAFLAIYFASMHSPGSLVDVEFLRQACKFADLKSRAYQDVCGRFGIQPHMQCTPFPDELDGSKVYLPVKINHLLQTRIFNKKISVTNGCFDILHEGHLKLLEEAGNRGPLVVFVNDDESVSEIKGDRRPVRKLEQRVSALARLPYVSAIVPFSGRTPVNAYLECGIQNHHCSLFKGVKDAEKIPSEEASFFKNIFLVESGNISTSAILEAAK